MMTADRISGAPLMRQVYGVVNARCEQHAGESCCLCPPQRHWPKYAMEAFGLGLFMLEMKAKN